jgi:hypothetical protein
MQTNLDRRGLRPIPIICHCLDPPSFSLPTTFNKNTTFSQFRLTGQHVKKSSLIQ